MIRGFKYLNAGVLRYELHNCSEGAGWDLPPRPLPSTLVHVTALFATTNIPVRDIVACEGMESSRHT